MSNYGTGLEQSPARRVMLHLDLDAFFCSVEELRDPTLVGIPFAVGGSPDGRGVVASCSYAARSFGVRSAMPMGKALALCPTLRIISSNYGDYKVASQQVMRLLHSVTPHIEQISIDEAFLDITDRGMDAMEVGYKIQSAISSRFGLSCSIGIASNKLMAKIATDVAKSKTRAGTTPRAVLEVPRGEERAFLAPLPAGALWGVGPMTAERLASIGMRTIGDIAMWPRDDLIRRFGKHGADLHAHAQGVDTRPISTERAAKSISKETTFVKDVDDAGELTRTLFKQAAQVSAHLHKSHLRGSVVKIKIRWADFTTLSRQTAMSTPTDDPSAIYEAANKLLCDVWTDARPVRLIGVGVSGIAPPAQLSLWDEEPARRAEQEKKTEKALALLKARFGEGALFRGSDLIAAESDSATEDFFDNDW